MHDFLKKIIGDKKEWWAMEARAKALPYDYRIVYGEIQQYMWVYGGGDHLAIMGMLKDVLELFETGAADGKRALAITGEDLASFCDELLRNANISTENWRDAMNRRLKNKLRNAEHKQ